MTLKPCGPGLLLAREGPCQLAQGFLVTLVGNAREVAGEFQAHALSRVHRFVVGPVETFKEIRDGYVQDAGDLEQAPGRNAVDPALVFMRLLVGDADHTGHLLLR